MSSASSVIGPAIHILGAGSIGQLWAVSIRSKLPSHPVTLLLRGAKTAADLYQTFWWKQFGISASLKKVSIPVEIVGDHLLHDPISTLVVTTKSYQAKEAVQSVIHRLTNTSRVVLLCNGALSVRDELLPILGGDSSLILASTTHGAYRENTKIQDSPTETSSCLVHAGVGKTFIQDEAGDLADLWNSVGLNCSTMSSAGMEELLWKKLAANCVINPLTSLYQCANGELLIEPFFYEMQQEVLFEVASVAQSSVEKQSEGTLDEVSLRQFVQQVIQDTKENKSSMLQDVLHRKRTEIEHLNGYIVKKGRALGIECPANEDLVSRIQDLASGST